MQRYGRDSAGSDEGGPDPQDAGELRLTFWQNFGYGGEKTCDPATNTREHERGVSYGRVRRIFVDAPVDRGNRESQEQQEMPFLLGLFEEVCLPPGLLPGDVVCDLLQHGARGCLTPSARRRRGGRRSGSAGSYALCALLQRVLSLRPRGRT